MIREFKEFALKGSLLDVAIGFVLGVAFATVVNSLVADVLTPLIGAVFGQPDFSGLSIRIGEAEILYGNFINALISFLLVALALFLFVVKPYNALKARQQSGEEPELEPAEEVLLLREIRDALRQGSQ
ncbi:MAG TPA: large conductance mechanosensitive channel protein MscL [Acidimicrobiia bacterium]|jgi:large conductance mechanosensitive channel|nr:large conductance mechanosensitive channel protein MscL [Acidimicrobiia bacterium]